MNGSGKSGNNNKKHQRFLGRKEEATIQERKKPVTDMLTDGKFEKSRQSIYERPRWTEPKLPTNPFPVHTCSWCGKPIKDITTALSDKTTSLPVHFDCVLARLNEMETLDKNDTICYIGGGRFGVIHYNNPPDIKDFTIKRIFEWENKDNQHEWHQSINKYFSIT